MAKVRIPALSGIASGKIGDLVFFRRFGQDIARIRVKPANPRTPKQQTVRYNLSALSQAWKGNGSLVKTDEDGQLTGYAGTKYVMLRKFDYNTNSYTEVVFPVLSEEEKQAWIDYVYQTLKKPMAWGRLEFIGQNIRLLMQNQDPIRAPVT